MKRYLLGGLCLIVAIGLGRTATPEQPKQGLLIAATPNGQLDVAAIGMPPSKEILSKPGLLVWSDEGRDRWKSLPTRELEFAPESPDFVELVRFGSRGNGAASTPASLPPTTQLAQLVGQLVVRGNGFITPPDKGVLLDGRLTVRRRADDKTEAPFPQDELEFSQDGRVVLRIGVDPGEQITALGEISGLPNAFQNGLPPGEYTLRAKSGGASATFRVVTPAERQRAERRIVELKRLLGKDDDPLLVQVLVETLLTYRNTKGQMQPFLSDVLDTLERQHKREPLTGRLRQIHEEVLTRLEGKPLPSSDVKDATGIAAIDAARAAIAAGNWDVARKMLDKEADSSDHRTQGLVQLYRAVILAESGQATGEEATGLFLQALELLNDSTPADKLRGHNNLATFLLNRAQDRIYNHAAQMASGVQNPLMASLLDWHLASQHLQRSQVLAKQVDDVAVSAVQVNMARLHGTLADLLRVVNTDGEDTSTRELLANAEARSSEMARNAATNGAADETTKAVAEETLAHLAFRQGNREQCQEHAQRALLYYLNVGSLAGCEGIYRLRGLLGTTSDLKETTNQNSGVASPLRDLMISHLLTEMLRERIPADQVGLGRAGFLARRTYVNEKIIELLIEQGRAAEALRFAELAKARTLSDVLSAGHSANVDESAHVEGFDILSDWPRESAALEYFIGSERAWVFLVAPDAKVEAFPILDDSGMPIAARQLIGEVQSLINRFDLYGPAEGRRIANAAASGRDLRFEQSWQDELHRFYRLLIPQAAMPTLQSVPSVVIVPHHILHYFPFAALVTEPDESITDATRMPLPKFLLEQPFAIVHAPSLTTWRQLRRRENRALEKVNVIGIVDFGGRAARLDGVATEIANLKATFGERVQDILSDRQASETAVRSLLARPGILSISTHGQKIPDRPLEAYLICQPDERHDGLLRAGELYSFDIQSDLVLLNACYGGFADRSPLPADDLFGVQRALLHSGARTVVSGLWDIYDATAPDIMNDFWRRVAAGHAAPRSLNEAQRGYLKTWREFPQEPLRLLTHPYYWAVFTVAGDDRTGQVLP